MFVLGTAGHIDHGKSSLIQAMTGINPDRLPEEQARGMTIDLGFAWLRLPSGEEIGLIDVPGHERFVRNMVAGAGGIHAAMLVVAADDGWMPQTQEHLDILRLLDIRHGLVALTKIDLVEKDWQELVAADIRTHLAGTFLADAPIIPVSSVTKEGVETVVRAIDEIARSLQAVADMGKPRLFIDRVFVLTGIGVVVTGTSRGGGFSSDSDVYHFPAGNKVRVRALQSHEKTVARVGAGFRVAVNLGGVSRDQISRGDVLTGFPFEKRPVFLAAGVKNLPDSDVTLDEGRRVLFILGTTETEAVIRPFDDLGLKPGEKGLAIIKAAHPVAAFVGDNFILRLPTPQVTVGGGRVLDLFDHYPRRRDLTQLAEYLTAREDGDLKAMIITELDKRFFMHQDDLLFYSDFSTDEIRAITEALAAQGAVARHNNRLGLAGKITAVHNKIIAELKKVHDEASYLKGLTSDELARRVNVAPNEQWLLLLEYLEQNKLIGRSQQFYHLPAFAAALDPKMKAEADRIMAYIETAGHNYPTMEELDARFPGSRKTVNFLRDRKDLTVFAGQYVTTAAIWKSIIGYIEERLERDGRLTVAEFRDRFGNSRKYALPVLEYLDRMGVTRREEDIRVKGGRYDERHTL
jgi:selenocysteine-specific elongation factor